MELIIFVNFSLRLNGFQSDDGDEKTSLNLDNAIWANSVIASGNALGVVIYTGLETRSVMNTSQPASKVD